MDIYIIRHTTPDVEKGICYGQTDLGLTENYKEEFRAIAQKLPNIDTYKIISSPLKRCALLAQYLGQQVHYDNRLKELNFGDWELKAWNEIPEEVINPWMNDFVNVRVPNGESYTDLASRVQTFFEELRLSKDNQNVIVTTHAGPIRSLLAMLLNIPLEKSFGIKINYGDVFQLRKEGTQLKLISENDVFN
ncbi:alpha-ribazole phosphatase [Seonamhaeicola sp.]|uniref:alpha-ribazole phosphatase n=1 Tax=Seonamhaeicola sp. TaxID=1912245 RepID=UPI002627841B|nr:alpha-ribazole phosphatase [Seonamhaeicola sp.]